MGRHPAQTAIGIAVTGVIVVAVVGSLVAGVMVSLSMVPRPDHGYGVVLSGGSILDPERQGEHFTSRWTIHNTGKPVPDLTLWFHGIDSWIINGALSDCGGQSHQPVHVVVSAGKAFDFGGMRRGRRCHVVIELTAKSVGTHTLSFDTYTTLKRHRPGQKIESQSFSIRVPIRPY